MGLCRIAKATMLLLLLLLCQIGIVEPNVKNVEGNPQHVTDVTAQAMNLRQMVPETNERKLHRRRRRRNRNPVFVNGRGRNNARVGGRGRGKGMGKGKGKGKGGSSSSKSGSRGKGGRRGGGRVDRIRYAVEDDFFYDEDDGYVAPPRRGRRSRYHHTHTHTHEVTHTHTHAHAHGGSRDGGGAVIVVRPADRSPVRSAYRGTGIGRIDRGRGRSVPRPGRSRPERPDMIRPQTPTSAPPTATPTSAGPTPLPTTAPPGGLVVVTASPGGTTAPGATTSAPAANDIVIRTDFGLTYFSDMPTDVDRDLTAEEYAELQALLTEFYTTEFQADQAFAGDFISHASTLTSMTYTMGGTPNVMTSFDADFVFADGSTITPNQVLAKMESLDYMAFINDYLFRNPPLNQLDAVMEVSFSGSSMAVPAAAP